ncbi:MAG: hypothetical protein KJO82_02265 [Gammaproteobacteria bacterium]|nr:hypothetical protein [Gammaproteobacteria bacterium]
MTPIRILATLAALAVIGFVWQQNGDDGIDPVRPIRIQYIDSVAVLPLENRTGDAAFDHIGVGIAEEITTHLARMAPLKVISHHSAQAVNQQELTTAQLGNALNVRHIIRGAIERTGDQLSVDVRHYNAEQDTRVWAEKIDGAPDDTAALQENVARIATSNFVDTIPGLTLPAFGEHDDAGPGQAAYLAGKRWLGDRTVEGLQKAITQFQLAIELNPGYAPAYADLSSAYALSVFYRYDVGVDGYTLAAQSLAFAEHAIALDANLAAGYAARGYIGALVGGDGAAVEADFERAAALQPNTASIPSWRARSLALLGQFEEALAEASRAVDLDPLAPARHIALAELSLQLGRYEQAIASAKMATALEPRIFRSRAIEARALLLHGNPQRCASMALGPHHVLRATCLRLSGQSAEAETIIEDTLADIRNKTLRVNGATEVVVFEDLAVYYALRGEAENAMFWSARAYAASPAGLEIRVLESALFDKVRDDPAFSSQIAAIRENLYSRVMRDSQAFR